MDQFTVQEKKQSLELCSKCTCVLVFFIITIIGIVRAIQGTAALKQEYDNN